MGMSPPPFQPGVGSRKTSNPTQTILIILGVLALFCCVACGSCAFMGKSVMDQVMPTAKCAMVAEALSEASKEYAKEHDGKMPTADGWIEELAPYYKKQVADITTRDGEKLSDNPFVGSMFPDPTLKGPVQCVNTDASKTELVYNSDLSGVIEKEIKDASSTPLFFEVNKCWPNKALPGKDRPTGKGPKIMNEAREWMVMYVDGEMKTSGGKRFRVRAN